jgi:hypothetical protein
MNIQQAYKEHNRAVIVAHYCAWASKFDPMLEGYYGA